MAASRNKKSPRTKGDRSTVTYRIAPPRMPPIPEQKMTRAQREAAAALIAGPRGHIGGPFNALLRSPELMNRVQKVGEYIRFVCPLSKRINEFAAIIAARQWSQQFEWWAHVKQGVEAGMKASHAQAIAEGRRPKGMREDEEIVYDFLTEVFNTRGACDETYARTLKKFGEQGVIDLLAIAGYYALLAMVMNVARTPVPEGPVLPLPAWPVRFTQS